jgi:predicted phage terminase large subunit-like protein
MGEPVTSLKRKLHALLRNDFRAFTEKTFTTLSPGDTFEDSPHIHAIAWALERVRRGELKRLIINMPPRSLKSITASVAFPAYSLGHDPTQRIICVSYSGELAKKHSNDFRAVIETEWYKEVFPSTRIGSFKNTETEIEFTKRGSRLATSVGGTLTGRGGDTIIIDDPLKPDDALSQTRRAAVNAWYTHTLLSRLDDKRTGAIIIVMQRVHIDDLTGFLRSQSDEWEVLSLPAIAPQDELIPVWNGDTYERKAGEVLSPREPTEILNALKLQLGSDAFYAQYQQAPAPPGGAMIKRNWIARYDQLPPETERIMVLQSWDTANKGGPDNDWSVCSTWVFARGQRFYLVDMWRGQVDYPSLKAKVQKLAKEWQAKRVLVEDAGAGTMLVQELRTSVSGIIAVRPERDKITRISVASAKMEAGQVFLPVRAAWLPDLEDELFTFPGSRHDDQCDSISQALLEHNMSFMSWMTPTHWQGLLEKSRKRGPLPSRTL